MLTLPGRKLNCPRKSLRPIIYIWIYLVITVPFKLELPFCTMDDSIRFPEIEQKCFCGLHFAVHFFNISNLSNSHPFLISRGDNAATVSASLSELRTSNVISSLVTFV
jgi:hypothetical protein